MADRTRVAVSVTLAAIMVVLLAGFAVWYRLAQEGRLPPPTPWVTFGALVLLLCLPIAALLVYRTFVRETEDAAALRWHVLDGVEAPEPPRDFTRDYPLVFRPEWRTALVNAGTPVVTLLLAVGQTQKIGGREKAVLLVVLVSLVAAIVGVLMSRHLTVSWPGVTFKEWRRERFWAWDQIEAVVLWERLGRRRPGLRLRSLYGEREFVSLGGIDFAREDLLFEVLLSRIPRLEADVDGHTIALTPQSGLAARMRVAALLAKVQEATEQDRESRLPQPEDEPPAPTGSTAPAPVTPATRRNRAVPPTGRL